MGKFGRFILQILENTAHHPPGLCCVPWVRSAPGIATPRHQRLRDDSSRPPGGWWWRRWRRWGDHPMVQTAWMRNVSEIWWDQDPRYAKTKSRWNMVKPTKYCWTWYCILSTRASFILFSIHAWDHLYKGDNQYVDCKFWFPMVSAYQFPIYYIPCITCNYIPSYVLLHPMYYMYYIPCNYIPSYAH